MDINDILARFGSLPGQVPDVMEEEAPFHRLARLDAIEDRTLVDMYRRQGLPVDECDTPEIFILEPLACSHADAGHPVLFEPGIFTLPGKLETVCRRRTLTISWKLEAAWRDASVRLQIFELQNEGVTALEYRTPAPDGCVRFIAPPGVFAVRIQLAWETVPHGILFGPRLFIS